MSRLGEGQDERESLSCSTNQYDFFICRGWVRQPLWFTGTSESDVRLRLAMNDSQALHSGKRHEVHNHVAPGLFIYLGLELEDLQCVFLLAVYWPLADKFSGVDLPWMQLNWVPMQQVFSEQRFLSDQIRSGVALMHGLRFNTSTYLRWLRFACPLTKKVAESHWEPMRSNFIFRLRSTPPSIVTFSCSSMNGICGMHRPIAPSMIFADFYLWNQ